jgi:hypothetical protein
MQETAQFGGEAKMQWAGSIAFTGSSRWEQTGLLTDPREVLGRGSDIIASLD